MKGRDLNGMRATGWSRPNLAAIKSVKVDKNCTNEQLLVAIRKIVCESVIQLRGTNADDKYRNIIDMLMLRIRGALAETIEKLEENAVTADADEITQSVVDATTNLIESKIDPKNGLILISKDSMSLLASDIVVAISNTIASGNDKSSNEDDIKKDSSASNENKTSDKNGIAKNDNNNDNNLSQQKANVKQADTVAANVTSSQQVTQADIDKLKVQLDESFSKIEALIQSNVPATTAEVKQDNSKLEPAKTAVEVQKNAKDASDKLQQKTESSLIKVKKKHTTKKKSKLDDVLTGKQYNSLMKTLDKYQSKVTDSVMSVSNAMADSFKKLHKALDKIYDKLKSNKVSWLAIIAGISLILIPLFWNKIKSFFSTFLAEFDLASNINGAITALTDAIDWNGHVSTILGKVWEAIVNAFTNFIQNPFDSITAKFTGAYEAMIQWTKDIWGYIKEKLSWTKQKQDENEEKAEKDAAQSFSAAMGKLEQHTDANVKQVQEQCDKACDMTSNDVAQKTTMINQDVQKMQEDATSQITAMAQDIKDNQDNINSTVLPGLDKDLHDAVDNAEQKCNEKIDSATTASESKLNSAIDDLDKTIKENGAPTGVSTQTIDKMEAAVEGSNISSSTVDQAVKTPANVIQTTATEQGKTVQLYANKNDVSRAASENKEVAQLAGNVAAVQNVTNVNNASSSTTQANFESKVLVNSTGNPASNEAKMYEDMNAVMSEASRNCTTVEVGLNRSQKSLDALREKVNDYFTQLNDVAKKISDKSPAQQNSNVVLFSGGQQDGVCMEGV